jgi:hypothetical protein
MPASPISRRSRRRDDLDPELVQRAREVDHAALVEDRYEGALDLQLAQSLGDLKSGMQRWRQTCASSALSSTRTIRGLSLVDPHAATG